MAKIKYNTTSNKTKKKGAIRIVSKKDSSPVEDGREHFKNHIATC